MAYFLTIADKKFVIYDAKIVFLSAPGAGLLSAIVPQR